MLVWQVSEIPNWFMMEYPIPKHSRLVQDLAQKLTGTASFFHTTERRLHQRGNKARSIFSVQQRRPEAEFKFGNNLSSPIPRRKTYFAPRFVNLSHLNGLQ